MQLRLFFYDGKYDIDFNFDLLNQVASDQKILIEEVHSYTKKIANKFNITAYFGGLEPAIDKNTRYFTQEKKGPLH